MPETGGPEQPYDPAMGRDEIAFHLRRLLHGLGSVDAGDFTPESKEAPVVFQPTVRAQMLGHEMLGGNVFTGAQSIKQELEVTQNDIRWMRPELLSLSLGDRTFRFPRPYLEEFIRWRQGKPWRPADLRDFAATRRAMDTVERIRQGFMVALNELLIPEDEGFVDAIRFTDMLGLHHLTSNEWRRRGLSVITQQEWPNRRRIPLSALQSFCEWRYPDSYPQEWR